MSIQGRKTPMWLYRTPSELSVSTSASRGTFVEEEEYERFLEWKESDVRGVSVLTKVVEEVENLRRQIEALKEERHVVNVPTAPMCSEDKIILKKEVFKLLETYPTELQPDYGQTWKKQCNKIRKILLPRLKKDLPNGIPFSFSAAEDVIKTRLKSKRYSEKLALNPTKVYAEKRRHHVIKGEAM